MVFNQNTAKSPDAHLQAQVGRYLFSRQRELIFEMVKPEAGERVLDIGCGTGNHLRLFKEKWCQVTGLDPSAKSINIAINKLGHGVDLIVGQPEDIPFSDDEFDIVTVINALETSYNPRKVISEAIRVCRGRVFIGFINNYSLAGTRQKLKELFGMPLSTQTRFYSINEIKLMVGSIIANPEIKWGSVIYFPAFVYSFFEELEEMLPVINNPLGAFTGLIFPVKYTYRTVQHPLIEPFNIKEKARRPAPGTARDMLQETQK
ncbi:MAG: methyltransferase domain-containing protein [Syntrophaceae bacterium]|nr:methyltransferase domain-containing protein [Syntrophaceae bacterium]